MLKTNKKNYSVTVSMISYNDEIILEDCLASIRNQDYDQKLINILMVDGGSTDNTLEIAKKYNAIVVSRPDLKNQPTVRGGMGITLPTTDLILSFSAPGLIFSCKLSKLGKNFSSGLSDLISAIKFKKLRFKLIFGCLKD